MRSLAFIVPVWQSLGPLLNTIGAMTRSVAAFVMPALFVFAGFATLFEGTFSTELPQFETFAVSMRSLFAMALGNFDFAVFDEASSATRRLYGQVGCGHAVQEYI